MSYFWINMLQICLIVILFYTAQCEKEGLFDLSDFLDDKDLIYELQKRLGDLDEDDTKVGCYDPTGTLQKGLDSECMFHSNSSKIIKTTESLSRGAKYLEEFTNVTCPRDCSERCCQNPDCDTAVYRNKDGHNCYLFHCGNPSGSMCVFVHHEDYWMTSVSINIHTSHSFVPGGGTISHENELENLGTVTVPDRPHRPLTTPKTTPSPTTTTVPTTTHAPGLGDYCPSYEIQCEDVHAECILKVCQCRVGYQPMNGICRVMRCQSDELQCEDVVPGPAMRDCIPAVYRCDGKPDCINGSDERNCPDTQQAPAFQDEDISGNNNVFDTPSLNAQYANTKDNQFQYGFPIPGLPKAQPQGSVLGSANQLYPQQLPTNQNVGGQYYVPGLTNQNLGLGIPQAGGQISNQWPFMDKNSALGAPIYQGPVQYPTGQQGYIPGQNGYVPFLQNPLIPVQPVNPNSPIGSVNNGGASNVQQPLDNAAGQSQPVATHPTARQPVLPVLQQSSTSSPHQQYKPAAIDKPDQDETDSTDFGNRFPTFPDHFDKSSSDSLNRPQHNFEDINKAATMTDSNAPKNAGHSDFDKGQLYPVVDDNEHGRHSAEVDSNMEVKQRTYPPSTKSKLQIGSPTQSTVPGQKGRHQEQGSGKSSEGFLDYPWMGLSYDTDSQRISSKKGRPGSSNKDRPRNRQQTKKPDVSVQKEPTNNFDKDKDELEDVGKFDTIDTIYDNSNSRYPDRLNPANRYDTYRRPGNNRRPSYDRYNDRFQDSRPRPGHGSRYPAYYDQGPGYQPGRGRQNFPVWDQLKDEYYYPNEFDNRRLGPNSDVDYEEFRPDDMVNSDNRPFLDKSGSGPFRQPSAGTGSSSDGTQSSDRNPNTGKEPATQNVGTSQKPVQQDVQSPLRKTTLAPVEAPPSTNTPEPETQTGAPESEDPVQDTEEQVSVNSDQDSTDSDNDETQSNVSDQTDNQSKVSAESKNRNKSDSIEVMFLDKNTVVESYTDNNQGPIVALALGLGITLVMLIFVGCRLRNVKRRLRKGRALHSNEADYLINGMYL